MASCIHNVSRLSLLLLLISSLSAHAPEPPVQVTCATCHRGQAKPEMIEGARGDYLRALEIEPDSDFIKQ